jgi:hypothetical protein
MAKRSAGWVAALSADLTTARKTETFTMADSKPSTLTIPIDFPSSDEAVALAQYVKRIGYEDVNKFASPCITYGGRSEAAVMWSAVCLLQGQLAEAGFAPR